MVNNQLLKEDTINCYVGQAGRLAVQHKSKRTHSQIKRNNLELNQINCKQLQQSTSSYKHRNYCAFNEKHEERVSVKGTPTSCF